jgi:hypothetical protein
MEQIMNHIRSNLIVAALAVGVIASAVAQGRSGDITLSGVSVAAGIGYTRGDGLLHFSGKEYPFAVNGLSVVDVGISHFDGIGEVYNLQRVQDFPGTYVSTGAGATVAGGGDVALLENQKGVRILFHSTTQGLKLNLSADGVAVALK